MAQLLLVGNSRWHWAEAAAEGWRCWHGPPPTPGQPPAWDQLRAWAAVGGVQGQLQGRALQQSPQALAQLAAAVAVTRLQRRRQFGAPALLLAGEQGCPLQRQGPQPQVRTRR
ncbi:MAG: hypothetical protein EB136_10025 [Synechococcaceae bacterium WBB_3_034]|nr:hypothetical protein [Synechococcaceae bacterium WBB_3_034]